MQPKKAEDDLFGFLETIVEYYTGLCASQLTDEALAMKVAHIIRIREMEAEQTMGNVLKAFLTT